MTQETIQQLPAGAAPSGAELVPAWQVSNGTGLTVYLTTEQIAGLNGSALAALESEQSTLMTLSNENTTAISGLTTSVAANTTSISGINGSLTSQAASISGLNTQITAANSELASHAATLATDGNAITVLNARTTIVVNGTAVTLAPGDKLQVGGVSSGSPGSGSAIIAGLGLDQNGNASANVVPRTNALAALKNLVSEPSGELASANDFYAIVQYQVPTGNASIALIYRPDNVNITATSGALPCYPKSITLGSPSAGTYTLANGQWDGQGIDIIVNSSGNAKVANVPLSAFTRNSFQWIAADSAWVFITALAVNQNGVPLGSVGSALGVSAVALGGSGAVGALTQTPIAAGLGSAAFASGQSVGQFASGINYGIAIGDYSLASGFGAVSGFASYAQGDFSTSINGAQIGDFNSNCPVGVGTVTAGSGTTTPTISFVLTTHTNASRFNVGSKVNWSNGPGEGTVGGTTDASFSGVVVAPAPNSSTGLIYVQFSNVGAAPAGNGPQTLLTGSSGTICNTCSGQNSDGINNANCNNQQVHGDGSIINSYGSAIGQFTRYKYVGHTTAASTAGLTLDGNAFNNLAQPGDCNCFVFNDVGLTYGGYSLRVTIIGKDKTAAGFYKICRDVQVYDDNGTITLNTSGTIGTDFSVGSLVGSTFSLQVNSTYKCLIIYVTPATAHSTQWTALIEQVEAA